MGTHGTQQMARDTYAMAYERYGQLKPETRNGLIDFANLLRPREVPASPYAR